MNCLTDICLYRALRRSAGATPPPATVHNHDALIESGLCSVREVRRFMFRGTFAYRVLRLLGVLS